jgi:Tfp pilus assembly protein PilO
VKFRGEIWRQRLWVWLPALIFFLANVGAFAVYKLGYAGRVESLQSTLDMQKQTLSQLTANQQESRIMLARVETNERQVAQLYAERLSTRRRRLTGITTEVKEIARKTGLVPRTFSYPEEEFQEYGLIKRSYVFNANGTYAELRKFISLLEASPSFLSLDELTVSSNTQGEELSIALTLSTLFARDSAGAAPAPPPAAGPNGAAAVSRGLSSRGTPGGTP